MNRRSIFGLAALPLALTLGACSSGSTPAPAAAPTTDAAACASVAGYRTDRTALVDGMASGSMSLTKIVEAKVKLAARLTGASAQAATPELRDALRVGATSLTTGTSATPTPEEDAAIATTHRLCP